MRGLIVGLIRNVSNGLTDIGGGESCYRQGSEGKYSSVGNGAFWIPEGYIVIMNYTHRHPWSDINSTTYIEFIAPPDTIPNSLE